MAKFDVSQRVKVVDVDSSHNGQIGTVTVIAPKKDAVFYWLMFGPHHRVADSKITKFSQLSIQPTSPSPTSTEQNPPHMQLDKHRGICHK